MGVPQPLPAPKAGPSGSVTMVASSVLALGAVPAPADASQLPKRARRGTQTKEGARKLAPGIKKRERERKRAREHEGEENLKNVE